MSHWKLVKASPFENAYGGLELHQNDEGHFILRMEDPMGGREALAMGFKRCARKIG